MFSGAFLITCLLLLHPVSLLAQSASEVELASRAFDQLTHQKTNGTHFIGVVYAPALSQRVRQSRHEGYELSSGEIIQFHEWYHTNLQDVHLSWMTEINSQWALIWGGGTGERGSKYIIDPSLQIGLLFRRTIGLQSTLSIRASARIGGHLREKPCLATYPLQSYDAPQSVNCRLAATYLEPQETLQYLFNEPPPDRMQLHISYMWIF